MKTETIANLKWLLNIPSSEKEAKGLEAEEKAEKAIRYLMERGVHLYDERRIETFEKTWHFSSDDKRGIDFKVTLIDKDNKREELLIQVKSYWKMKEQKSYGAAGICFIGIWPREVGSDAVNRVATSIANFLHVKKGLQKIRDLTKKEKALDLWIVLSKSLIKREQEDLKKKRRILKRECHQCKRSCYTNSEKCPSCGKSLKKI